MPILNIHITKKRPNYRIRMFDKEDNPITEFDPEDYKVEASSVVEALDIAENNIHFKMASKPLDIYPYHKVVRIGASTVKRVLDPTRSRTYYKEYIDEYGYEFFREVNHALHKS